MVLLLALLAGDARAADALAATLTQLGVPPVLSTIEDYMWAKLTLLLAAQVIWFITIITIYYWAKLTLLLAAQVSIWFITCCLGRSLL